MKAKIKIEGDTLQITFTGVQNAERGRLCNIELALLRQYGSHNALAWVAQTDGYLVQWVRGDSDHGTYFRAREVLKRFALEV